MDSPFFSNSCAHLLAELERIDLLLKTFVARARRLYVSDSQFQGLFISEQELDALLTQPVGLPQWVTARTSLPVDYVRQTIGEICRGIERQKKESRKQGVLLRLEQLSQLFHLSRLDIDLLLLCLTPELDRRYEKIFAYLQDDVTRKHPSIDLVLNVLTFSIEEKMDARRFFLPDAPLIRHRILQCYVDPGGQNATFLSHFLKVDDRIVNYLLELESIDQRLGAFVDHDMQTNSISSNWVPPDLKDKLEKLAKCIKANQHQAVVNLVGGGDFEQTACAMTLSRYLDMGLITFDLKKIMSKENVDADTLLALLDREAVLQHKAIFLTNADCLGDDTQADQFALWINAIKRWRSHLFLSIPKPLEAERLLADKLVLQIRIQPLTYESKLCLWRQAFASYSALVDDADLADIASAFKFSGNQILQAAKTAHQRAAWKDPDNIKIDKNGLNRACQIQTNQKLSQLAQKIIPHYAWNDIVLPEGRFRLAG